MKKIIYSFLIAGSFQAEALLAQSNPVPWNLNASGNYAFASLSQYASALPASMVIHQMNTSPVALNSAPSTDVPANFNQLQSAYTNVWGLNAQGIGIRSNPQFASSGYIAGRSGEVIVAVNTTGRTQVEVSFKAGTYAIGTGQSATFRLRCQYRVGSAGPWSDMPAGPAEYQPVAQIDSVNMGPYALPASVDDQPVVQVRWLYYYVSGAWTSNSHRSHRVQLDDISISSRPIVLLPSPGLICATASPFTLNTGTPAGGSYSGTGVSNGKFNPSLSGQGTFAVTYHYTDAFGISNAAVQTFSVDYNGCTTQLNAGTCGITETSFSQALYCAPINGATNYKYEVTDLSTNAVMYYVRGNYLTNFQLDWLSGTTYTRTYSIRLAGYVGGAWRPYGAPCTVTAPPAPSTNLQVTACGITESTLNQALNCIAVAGAGNYRYEITDLSNNAVVYYTRGNYLTNLQLDWISSVGYARNYSIRVASCVGGVWYGYGPACQVTTPPVPATQLQPASCGITLSALNQVLNCTPVIGAANYRYEITDLSNNAVVYYTRGNYLTNLQLNWIASMTYNRTYSIKVAACIGGAWTPYGNACSVTTPASPLTQLQASFCNIIESATSQVLYCVPVSGAANYRYELTDQTNGSVLWYTRGNYLTNFQMNWVAGVQAARTYNVRVASCTGGVWSAYGPVCQVTTGSSLARMAGDASTPDHTPASTMTAKVANLTASLFPNPNDGHAYLNVNRDAKISVMNLLGEILYEGKVHDGGNELYFLDASPGIYIVLVHDGTETIQFRMIRE